MATLLEVIGAEREALQAKLAALDEIERLAVAYGGAAAAVAAPAAKRETHVAPKRALPAKPKATGQGLDGLGPKATAALQAMRERKDWMTMVEVGATASVMQGLVRRGLVEAQGATSKRRYRAVQGPPPGNAGTTWGKGRAPGRPAKPQPNRNVLGERVLGQLKHRTLNEPQLAGVLDVSREQIADACGKLLLDDRIVMRPDGSYTVPLAAAA